MGCAAAAARRGCAASLVLLVACSAGAAAQVHVVGASGSGRTPPHAKKGDPGGCKHHLKIQSTHHHGRKDQGIPTHYSHFIVDYLQPVFQQVDPLPRADPVCIWHPESLVENGFGPQFVPLMFPGRKLRFTSAPNLPWKVVKYHQLLYDSFESHRLPRSAAEGFPGHKGPDVMIVKRSNTGLDGGNNGSKRRYVQNMDDVGRAVEAWCAPRGLRCVMRELEHMTPREQVADLLDVKVMIGIHGAGPMALVWSRHPKRVLLEFPPAIPTLDRMWEHIGVEYVKLGGQVDQSGFNQHGFNPGLIGRTTANVTEVIEQLARVYGEPPPAARPAAEEGPADPPTEEEPESRSPALDALDDAEMEADSSASHPAADVPEEHGLEEGGGAADAAPAQGLSPEWNEAVDALRDHVSPEELERVRDAVAPVAAASTAADERTGRR